MNKKNFFLFITLNFIISCTSPTAMLAPVYTFGTTGNTLQTGLSYGSNQIITNYTGKTPLENLKELGLKDKKKSKKIKKETLENKDFFILVENKIKKNRKIINLSTQ